MQRCSTWNEWAHTAPGDLKLLAVCLPYVLYQEGNRMMMGVFVSRETTT